MHTEKPLKRNDALRSVSRDHHHALLLCLKIKKGLSKGISADRIKKYSDWFYQNHILKHFELEEKYMFPVLGNENKLIRQALQDHQLLSKLFTDELHIEDSLKQIQTELEKHIRFEERILFGEIQKAATREQSKQIKQMHGEEKFVDNLSDEFWR